MENTKLPQTHTEKEIIKTVSAPSVFAKETLLYAEETCYIKNGTDPNPVDGKQKGYLLLYILAENGKLEYQGQHYFLKAHDVIFLDCTKKHRYSPVSDTGWEVIFFYFSGAAAPGYYKYVADHTNCPVFSIDNKKTVQSLFWQIHSLHNKQADYSELLISMNITRILTEICMFHLSEPVQSAQYPDVVNYVFYHLNTFYMDKITLDMLAEKFFVNKHYLMREFKRCAGKSIMEYLTEVRLSKAKNLLRYSSKSIEEIAAETGFCHATHFIRTFRKSEQVTPLFYRKQWSI